MRRKARERERLGLEVADDDNIVAEEEEEEEESVYDDASDVGRLYVCATGGTASVFEFYG